MSKNFKKGNNLQAVSQVEDTDESSLNIKESKFEENISSADTLPYIEAHAHLIHEFRWLNRLLTAHVLRLRQVNFYEGINDFHGIFIADEEIDALISEGIFESNDKVNNDQRNRQITHLFKQTQEIRHQIAKKIQNTLKNRKILPLAHLANCFQLNEFEYQALIICIAPQIDARYEKLYTYLQNDLTKKTPSVDLILNLLCHDSSSRLLFLKYFHPDEKLRHYGLIESLEENTAASASQYLMRADPRIVYYALGNNTIDHRLIREIDFLFPLKWDQVVIETQLQNRLQKLFSNATDDIVEEQPVFYLYVRQGVGKKSIARALCGEIGLPLAVVDVRNLLQTPEIFRAKVRLILREGLLQSSAIYFEHIEKLELANEENPTLFTGLINEIIESSWITFLGSEKPMPSMLLDLSSIYLVEISTFDHKIQQRIWKIHLDGSIKKNEFPDLSQLTSSFDLTAEQISKAVRLAKQSVRAQDPENGQITLDDLLKSSRLQSQPKLSTLARKIEPIYNWDDLVLPEDQKQQLQELANWVKHRQTVIGDWGFKQKLSLGHGISAFFVGPSGTGKTMAAEVMANHLGLDLYKIDLFAVVSKYIGETEKNLNQIFIEAEHSNAILFFDEADALFGKRSEVRDAHDRYANVEVAYLLQKMEEYEGLVILATNFSKNMDEAFVRRIHFSINFPFPAEKYRCRIWEKIWPPNTPRSSDLDLDFIAKRFKITGGNIRNIALAGAFLAANDGGLVNMGHLIHATQREYQKMGKVVMEGEFKKSNKCEKK